MSTKHRTNNNNYAPFGVSLIASYFMQVFNFLVLVAIEIECGAMYRHRRQSRDDLCVLPIRPVAKRMKRWMINSVIVVAAATAALAVLAHSNRSTPLIIIILG